MVVMEYLVEWEVLLAVLREAELFLETFWYRAWR